MRTVSVFKNGSNRAIRLPKDIDFEGVNELEIQRLGDVITLKPAKPSWVDFFGGEKADDDFLKERPVIIESGRFKL